MWPPNGRGIYDGTTTGAEHHGDLVHHRQQYAANVDVVHLDDNARPSAGW